MKKLFVALLFLCSLLSAQTWEEFGKPATVLSPGEIYILGVLKAKYKGKPFTAVLDTAYYKMETYDRSYMQKIIIPLKGTSMYLSYWPDYNGSIQFRFYDNPDFDALIYCNKQEFNLKKDSINNSFFFEAKKNFSISMLEWDSKRVLGPRGVIIPDLTDISEFKFGITYRKKDYKGQNNFSKYKPEEVRILDYSQHGIQVFDKYIERLKFDYNNCKHDFLKELLKGETDHMVRLKIIYDFISYNFEHDLTGKSNQQSVNYAGSLSELFQKLRCYCGGFTNMFRDLTHLAGIHLYKEKGSYYTLTRDEDWDIDMISSEPYAWNKIMFNWQWYYIDVTLNAGKGLHDKTDNYRENNYFLISEEYASDIYVTDNELYFTKKDVDRSSILPEQYTKIHELFHRRGYKFLTPVKEIEFANDVPLVFTIEKPAGAELAATLRTDDNTKVPGVKTKRGVNTTIFEVLPEENGAYYLYLFSRIDGEIEYVAMIRIKKL
ncbi:MAG: hypothetical protein KKA84_11795 [Bacteroidetes bacterium]|nr:hypothetical protein [Bacteroidota bacterium]